MFNTYIYKKDYSDGLSQISSQMKLDRESREAISKEEIKARDRVDISLEEYERMKDEVSSLRWQLNQMTNRLELFKEVIELDIIPDTMITLYDYNPINMESKCMIKFDFVPERGKRYY